MMIVPDEATNAIDILADMSVCYRCKYYEYFGYCGEGTSEDGECDLQFKAIATLRNFIRELKNEKPK